MRSILAVISLVSVGCASGSEMRRRNAVKIDALEKRVAALEAGKPAAPATGPTPQAAKERALEDKIDQLQAKIDTLQAELGKNGPAGDAERNRNPVPPPSPRYGLDATKHHAVQLHDSPSIGPAKAPVTMVAAVQFPEPYTHRVWPTLIALHGEYPKDLRIVFKSFIVHPTSTASSIAACAAGYQRKLTEIESAIYIAASEVGPGQAPSGGRRELDKVELREIARGLRLDLKQYDRDLVTCTAAQTRDQAMFQKLGQTAVPVFWINGRPLSGAQPIEAFRNVVEEEIAAAAADKARGGKPGDYYQRITADKPNPY